jgi:NhaA family Na+:H+ antiporter
MHFKSIYQFLQLESASGILLFMAALIAMIWANSPLAYIHQYFLDTSLFWINEGLMVLFFLVIGLELKRALRDGYLSQIRLSAMAALGGILIPALIYIMLNYDNPITRRAWSTPIATDIAFALGVLSLFGSRVPVSLKVFVLSLAIFDDIGAIIIIAFFHSHGLSISWLLQAVLVFSILLLIRHVIISSFIPYFVLGVYLWICLLYGGIHPTIAGVLLAFTIPSDADDGDSLSHRLENQLHPWAAFVIMPLFALANAGIPLSGLSFSIMFNTTVLGIILGLYVGKQLGVFAFSWLFIRCQWAQLPDQASWLQLYGMALLCGIGFTMSLFLGTLSFQDQPLNYLTEVRLGVIIGSILSGVTGAIVLKASFYLENGRKPLLT